ncbi:hypothetical protein ERO13_D04G097750v2 [Gossypium hirsutum]|uniref:Uncharacterized protein n=2 Tax=Gossypium TaxID=3633 RepID=A0A5D2VCP9_GOSMU|nr:hypothetical protein ERO13_D04G097750v2 [Gossypium hirsutum]TYH76981.1 hypothetical protein ES332_D04G122800v1 [Gossypium tomentosum]TYI87134.1 hypothetical protein E1A91_D04G115500v1 [Gossypium mustelinum]
MNERPEFLILYLLPPSLKFSSSSFSLIFLSSVCYLPWCHCSQPRELWSCRVLFGDDDVIGPFLSTKRKRNIGLYKLAHPIFNLN